MELHQRLIEHFAEKAEREIIEIVSIGVGYTAVQLTSGGMGLSYTYFESKQSCSLIKNYVDYEGQPANRLLPMLLSENRLERSMALALVNALNYQSALQLPVNRKNEELFDKLGIRKGSQVAMVGFFGPLLEIIKQREASLEVIDTFRGLGNKQTFRRKLNEWADVLILTSTSILNDTTEDVLEACGSRVRTIMLGPSTPLVKAAFMHLPVHILGGTVPVGHENVLKAIRHGTGTPVIQKFSRKSYLEMESSGRQSE